MEQIKIKTSWDDVTLGQYVELASVMENNYDEVIDKGVAMISALYEIDALQIPFTAFQRLSASLHWMNQPINKNKVKNTYQINETEYQLDVNFTEFTTAQYVDYTNYMKANDYIGMMSVVMIPKGHFYCDGGYDLNKTKKDIEQLSVTDAMGIVDFFALASTTFTKRIIHYLRRKIKRTLRWKKDKEKRKELDKAMKALEDTITESYRMF